VLWSAAGKSVGFVGCSVLDGGIGVIALNRGEGRNALSEGLVRELENALEWVSVGVSEGMRGLVVGSDVPGVFCAGADLKERERMSRDEVQVFVTRLRRVMSGIAQVSVPTVACLSGGAYGGGAELALACDFRFASSSAELAFPEVRLGVIPGAGGTQRLPRLVGLSRAKHLIFTGEKVDADRALAIGLVDRVTVQASESSVRDEAVKFLHNIAVSSAPLAIIHAKSAIQRGLECNSLLDAMKVEGQSYDRILDTWDRREGLLAFKEKRKPVFRGV